ncbi:MAG: calcium/sodium antiporter [Lachnospiraceae bacterium]|nr:calcium/sodium antiporter [Lachnospiraceae bacterium]
MLVPILLFILGLLCLIFGGDWFVDGAVGLAHKFKVPELLIGATIVSIGTTLPEVMVSATSAAIGHGEIAYGNAIGSIICNAALIAAITFAIKPGAVDKKSLRVPVIFFFIAAAVYMVFAYIIHEFSIWSGIILLAIFVVYMIICVKDAVAVNTMPDVTNEEEIVEEEVIKHTPLWKDILLLVVGAALIAVGARLLVDNGTIIALGLGVPESVVALTFVALGTSLPELVTAITSLVKGHGAISVGNICGANLFNLVLVSGLSITISPFQVPASKLVGGLNASLIIDLPLMAIVMLIMTVPSLISGKLLRSQGIVLLLIYAAFVAFQFVM